MTNRCDQTGDIFGALLDEKQLKAVIKERGWNQKQIAEYWGYSAKWISALIKNKNDERSRRDDCAFMGLPKK